MTMSPTRSSPRNTCPAWCIAEHGVYAGEDDCLHTGEKLRLVDEVVARLCLSCDPETGALDGPYVVVGSEEWTLDQARRVGLALVSLADQAAAATG